MREVRVDTLPFEWAHETARCIGVVAHRMLAQIGREGIAAWDDARVTGAMPRIRAELRGEGVDEAELDRATGAVRMAIANVLADEQGRWLFAAEHADAVSEWALAGIDGDAIAHVVLDRSFVADGVRWIVDFKTGSHEGADVRGVSRSRGGALSRAARPVCALRVVTRFASHPARPVSPVAARLERVALRALGSGRGGRKNRLKFTALQH